MGRLGGELELAAAPEIAVDLLLPDDALDACRRRRRRRDRPRAPCRGRASRPRPGNPAPRPLLTCPPLRPGRLAADRFPASRTTTLRPGRAEGERGREPGEAAADHRDVSCAASTGPARRLEGGRGVASSTGRASCASEPDHAGQAADVLDLHVAVLRGGGSVAAIHEDLVLDAAGRARSSGRSEGSTRRAGCPPARSRGASSMYSKAVHPRLVGLGCLRREHGVERRAELRDVRLDLVVRSRSTG